MHLSILSLLPPVQGMWGFDQVESLIPQPGDKLLEFEQALYNEKK